MLGGVIEGGGGGGGAGGGGGGGEGITGAGAVAGFLGAARLLVTLRLGAALRFAFFLGAFFFVAFFFLAAARKRGLVNPSRISSSSLIIILR